MTSGRPFRLDPEIVTPAIGDPVTLAAAKKHLNITEPDFDVDIHSYIQTATADLNGVDGLLGRCLLTQTWKEAMSAFPWGDCLPLALLPVQSITHVKYYDSDNAQQTLSASLYSKHRRHDTAYIKLADGESWPATYTRDDAVEIQYVAGYGPTGDSVPPGIMQAMRLHIGHMFEHREIVSEGGALPPVPMSYKHLLMRFRRFVV